MRYAILVLIIVASFLREGFTKETLPNELIIRVAPEQIEMRDTGMLLSTNAFGEIVLNNLHFDREGYFTIFQFAFLCTDCQKQFDNHSLKCNECGSMNLELISLNTENSNDLQAINSILISILNNFAVNNGEILCYKGNVSVGGSADTDGNKEIDVTICGESEDGSFCWEGSGTIEKDPEGNTNGRVEGRIRWNFSS